MGKTMAALLLTGAAVSPPHGYPGTQQSFPTYPAYESFGTSACGFDTSYSYKFCLEDDYDGTQAHGRTYVRTNDFVLTVTTCLSPFQPCGNPGSVVVTGAITYAGANGGVMGSNGYPYGFIAGANEGWKMPQVGGPGYWSFTYVPSWHQYWVNMDINAGTLLSDYSCSNTTATLHHGGSDWTWTSGQVGTGHCP